MNFTFIYSPERKVSILLGEERVVLRFGTTKFPNAYHFHNLPTPDIHNTTKSQHRSIERTRAVVYFMTAHTTLLWSEDSGNMADIKEKTFQERERE